MSGVACFADEGGLFQPCNTICIALLCFKRTPNTSLNMLGYRAVQQLYSLLGWKRGELKWRSVKKAARRRGVTLNEIIHIIDRETLAYTTVEAHLDSAEEAGMLKKRLLEEAIDILRPCLTGSRPLTLIRDANLVPNPHRNLPALRRLARANYVDIQDSRKYLGLQLADLYAGACSDNILDTTTKCTTQNRN